MSSLFSDLVIPRVLVAVMLLSVGDGSSRATGAEIESGQVKSSLVKKWSTKGFEAFRRGTFGNAGHNLYVSRAGVLQRINQFDLDKNGYFDVVICNSQDHREKFPTYVYTNPFGEASRTELPANGAMAGVVADLNQDGCDDLVLGMVYDGATTTDLNAVVYYGGPGGWSERRTQELPAPFCTAAAAGDFNADGRCDVGFLCLGKLRLFYQTELGFEPKRFVDTEIDGDQLGSDDLDGDGFADIMVRSETEPIKVRVYWGDSIGIDAARSTQVPESSLAPGKSSALLTQPKGEEDVRAKDATPLVRAIRLGNTPHVFVALPESVKLIPVGPNREFGKPVTLECPQVLAGAVGDVNGDRHPDLVLASREPWQDRECSRVYWGSAEGFAEKRMTRVRTFRACDLAVRDLDGDGCADIGLCQNQTKYSFTTESLIYKGTHDGVFGEPVRFVTHDARRVFLARAAPDTSRQVVFVNHFSGGRTGRVDVAVFMGESDGFSPTRCQKVQGNSAVDSLICDITDDGWPDLILANCSEMLKDEDRGSYVFQNTAQGLPYQPNWIVPSRRAMGVSCADLNRDGFLDLVFGGFDNPELVICHGTADGFDTANPRRIRTEHEGVVYSDARWMVLADLSGNGWLDLVVPQYGTDRSFILCGSPEGFSMDRVQFLSILNGTSATAADLTGNGYLDLIVGGHKTPPTGPPESFLYIYWNGPHGLREDDRTLLPAKAAHGLSVADFDNNGLLDIFVCSYDGGKGERDVDSYLYWNRSGHGFSAADRKRLFTHSAAGCVSADFNEDGWTDLAVANHKTWGDHIGNSAVWWNSPNGFSQDHTTQLPSSGPHGITSVDPGSIMDRGSEEYYISAPFKLPANSWVTKVSWEAQVPSKTWVKAQLRFAPTKEALESAPWMGPEGSHSWFDNRQKVKKSPGKWVQYRLSLGATNGLSTPRVTEVSVFFR